MMKYKFVNIEDIQNETPIISCGIQGSGRKVSSGEMLKELLSKYPHYEEMVIMNMKNKDLLSYMKNKK